MMEAYLAFMAVLQPAVLVISAITGAAVAVKGLATWRTQLKGRSEYDLARRFLRATLELRDAIARVRAPFMSAGEIQAAADEAGIKLTWGPGDKNHVEASRVARNMRWQGVHEAASALRVEELEAEVLWGRDVAKCSAALHAAITRVAVAEQEFYDRHGDREGGNPRDWEAIPPLRRIMWGSGSGEDQMAREIEDGVAEVEKAIRPRLKLSGTPTPPARIPAPRGRGRSVQ